MTKFDEAMLAPPEDNMMAETISGLLQRLTPQSGKESLLQAFMPLLPPFSAVQLIELHFPGSRVWYRCFEEGCRRLSGNRCRLFAPCCITERHVNG